MKTFLISVASAGIALLVAFLFSNHAPTLGAQQINYTNSVTSTVYTVGTTAVQLLATSTNRVYTQIQNCGSNAAWINEINNPIAGSKGQLLNVSSTPYIIDFDHLVIGAINAISDNGNNAKICVTDYNKNF